MDAFEFCKEFGRMCKVHKYCNDCPLGEWEEKTNLSCRDVRLSDEHIRERIEIVEKWSKEHPVKTMAQDFFEKFPNAPKIDGGPESCPWMCGYCEDDCRHFSKCIDCWNRPLGD